MTWIFVRDFLAVCNYILTLEAVQYVTMYILITYVHQSLQPSQAILKCLFTFLIAYE